MRPGRTTAGQKMAGMSRPPIWMSQPGIMRTAPSSQPMYQSGWAAVVASHGRYGPVEPHRVDLDEGGERGADAADQQQVAGGAQRVGRHHRRADDDAVAAALRPGTACGAAATAGRGERRAARRSPPAAGRCAPGRRGAIRPADGNSPPNRSVASAGPTKRDRLGDGEGDAQAGAGEQVVGQRVAEEAVHADQEHQAHADDEVDAARPPVRRGQEHAQHVDDQGADEDERRPVVHLPHQQAGGHVQAEVRAPSRRRWTSRCRAAARRSPGRRPAPPTPGRTAPGRCRSRPG